MKVLMIDDDPNVAEIVSLGLQMRWPEAELISTVLGEEGVKMVRNESPDIVILDLGLPDITGFQVLGQVRAFSNVPVIIFSVFGEEADIDKGMKLGATDYIGQAIQPSRASGTDQGAHREVKPWLLWSLLQPFPASGLL